MSSEQNDKTKKEVIVIQTKRTGKFVIREKDGTLKPIKVVAKVDIPITK